MPNVNVHKVATLEGHRDAIFTIIQGPRDQDIISGSGDGMAVLWDLSDPKNGQLLARVPHSVYALCYHKTHDQLIIGHNYEGIHFVDIDKREELRSIKFTDAAIFDIKYNGDDIIVGCANGMVYVIDFLRLTILHELRLSSDSARSIAVNPETNEIVIGFSDNHIRILDGSTYKVKKEFIAHENSVFSVRFTHDYAYLLTGGRDARLKVWDVNNGYALTETIVAHMFTINHIDFSTSGHNFVTCSMDKTIKVWDYENKKLLKVIDKPRHRGHGTSVNKLCWTNYEDMIVSCSDDRTLAIWQLDIH